MRRILAAALAVTLMTGSVLAEAGDDRRDRQSRHDERGGHGNHDRDARGHDCERRTHSRYDRERYAHNRHDHHRAQVAARQHARFHAGRYYRPAGYSHYAWHRGAHLPSAYYAPRYIVHDYHSYHLHRPPHGHHWVRVDHDVVLTAIATGAIVAVVNNLFY